MKKYTILVATLVSSLFSVAYADYKIFIDAGSSGSRLHLFQYSKGNAVPEIDDIFSASNKSPLSSFVKNPQEAGKSLQKLIDDAAKELKARQANPNDVEINVLATAGMRFVDEEKQKEIYASVKDYIQNSDNHFQAGFVGTISGKMEAIYGWLDVNYLSGNFQNNGPTLGSIDMGGASTQIAFETQNNTRSDDTVSFKLNGKIYNVFAKSFLGLGQDKARDAILTNKNSGTCFPTGYPMNPSNEGHFDSVACGSLYTDVINSKKVAEEMLPLDKQLFVAFSGAYYTYNFLEVDKTPNQADLEKRISKVCTLSWPQLKAEYPNVADKYLSVYCSNAVYMDQLFYSTYQLHNDQLAVITKIKYKDKEKDIDWTLGAMLFDLVK